MTDQTLRFKRQAEILRAFLAAAGIELKQTNALEAVARMNGAKNWNTLQATGMTQNEAPLFIVSTLGTGMTHNTAIRGEAAARRCFCAAAYRLSVLVDEPLQFYGQHDDGGLPYLVAQAGGITYLTLNQAHTADEAQIVKGRLIESPPVSLGVITESDDYPLVAAAIQKAFRTESEELRKARFAELQYSLESNILSHDWDAILSDAEVMPPAAESGIPNESELVAAFAKMRDIKMMVSSFATVKG